MALAIIVTLEKELPESAAHSKTASGKALARELDRLDLAARTVKVTAIEMTPEQQAAAAAAVQDGQIAAAIGQAILTMLQHH